MLVAAGATAAEPTGNLPVIDAHFHVMPYMDLGELQQAMDRHGIRAAGGCFSNRRPATRQ